MRIAKVNTGSTGTFSIVCIALFDNSSSSCGILTRSRRPLASPSQMAPFFRTALAFGTLSGPQALL